MNIYEVLMVVFSMASVVVLVPLFDDYSAIDTLENSAVICQVILITLHHGTNITMHLSGLAAVHD